MELTTQKNNVSGRNQEEGEEGVEKLRKIVFGTGKWFTYQTRRGQRHKQGETANKGGFTG